MHKQTLFYANWTKLKIKLNNLIIFRFDKIFLSVIVVHRNFISRLKLNFLNRWFLKMQYIFSLKLVTTFCKPDLIIILYTHLYTKIFY